MAAAVKAAAPAIAASAAPPDVDVDDDDDDETVEEAPLFDYELPWFQRTVGRDDLPRKRYTKAKCIVTIRVTDTVGDLRAKVCRDRRGPSKG